jgi:hypothetical protein
MLGLRRRLISLIARHLTKPRRSYRQVVANDTANLKRNLRKGDIILVDGDQRISEVIKYLSQSSWSHSAIYVGDEIAKRDPRDRALLQGQYGADSQHMVIEALMEGVVASPVTKYGAFNIRVCRPLNLRKEDVEPILDEILGQLGYRYDVRHIIDLARYLFPVSLIPHRFRRKALQLGSGLTREVICSTMIARAFQNVGFPILPDVTPTDELPSSPLGRIRDLVLRRSTVQAGIYRPRPPALVTPRDFDLSPYFEILKINLPDHARFDYRRINWAPIDTPEPTPETGTG